MASFWPKNSKNVSLYVCMSGGNSEMLVFLSVFSPTMRIFQVFDGPLGKKTEKMLFQALGNDNN